MSWASWNPSSKKSNMTANNHPLPDLSVATTTGLLERLSAETARHAASGEVLIKETRTRRLTLERRHAEVVASLDQQQAKEGEAVDAAWLGRWERTREHLERRQWRIEKAERNCQRELPRRIEAARGAWLGKLQHQRIARERELAAEANRLQEAFEARRSRIATVEQDVTKLTRRAHQAFNGSAGFRAFLKPADPAAESPEQPVVSLEEVEQSPPALTENLLAYRQLTLPRFFSILTPALLAVLIVVAAAIGAGSFAFEGASLRLAGLCAAGALAVTMALYLPAMKTARPQAAGLAARLNQAANRCARLQREAKDDYSARLAKIKAELEEAGGDIQSKWSGVNAVDSDFAAAARKKVSEQVPRLVRKN